MMNGSILLKKFAELYYDWIKLNQQGKTSIFNMNHYMIDVGRNNSLGICINSQGISFSCVDMYVSFCSETSEPWFPGNNTFHYPLDFLVEIQNDDISYFILKHGRFTDRFNSMLSILIDRHKDVMEMKNPSLVSL